MSGLHIHVSGDRVLLHVDREFLRSVFLASELQAAEIEASKPRCEAEELDAPLQDLRIICETLKLPDPAGRDARDAFSAVQQQVRHSLHVFCSNRTTASDSQSS